MIDFKKNWPCIVSDGCTDRVAIKRFRLTESDCLIPRIRGDRFIKPGNYTRLMVGKTLMMSDTPKEYYDHVGLFWRARGRVLVHGLGLGCALHVLLRKPGVDHVTVVEKEPDVIALVGRVFTSRFPKRRLTIIEGDAFTWKPKRGECWDVVWHDIWPAICADNLAQMATLNRRFGRRAKWQQCWSQDRCRHLRRIGY